MEWELAVLSVQGSAVRETRPGCHKHAFAVVGLTLFAAPPGTGRKLLNIRVVSAEVVVPEASFVYVSM